MAKGIFIIGTDTDVGKTFVTAGINYILRRNNYKAISFKPVQSGGIENEGKIISGDIKFIKDIFTIDESYENMNTYCFKEPVSPHLASKIENVCIDKNKILNAYRNLNEKYEYIVVEGAGGIVVPLIENEYFVYDLVKDLKLSCLIVCSSKVGTINHTALTCEFAKSKGIEIKGIIVNKYNNNFYEEDNIKTIENITKLKVIAKIKDLKENIDFNNIKIEYEKSINIEKILKLF